MTENRGGKREGAGRPRKPLEEKQVDFKIGVSGRTYAIIEKKAKAKKLTIRQYLRIFLESKFTK